MKKADKKNDDKELYGVLRRLSCEQLWRDEIPKFDSASPEERLAHVSLVRAAGVVFSESGTGKQKQEVRAWFRRLLADPQEKIRRYAMTALPKIGVGAEEEAELLELLKSTQVDRERKHLGEALQKIGGAATLAELGSDTSGILRQVQQKVKASVARQETPRTLNLSAVLQDVADLRINLHSRKGLEPFVREEFEANAAARTKFRIDRVRPGLVTLTAVKPFSLADLYSLRCFSTLGFPLGEMPETNAPNVEGTAALITSAHAHRIFERFSAGAIRYRLDFVSRGHQRGAVREVANRVYELSPEILNDARNAPWTVAVQSASRGIEVELRPKLTPDPRFAYRVDDVPAASHPPLAACLARLAGPLRDAVLWDPFCGSGLELVERASLGGVRVLHGTDLSAEAVLIARRNLQASEAMVGEAHFTRTDFRDHEQVRGLGAGMVDVIITNPPMGKRVPIPNLRGLMDDLLKAAETTLRPGGKLVFANPVQIDNPPSQLKRELRQQVDLGGLTCWLEIYTRRSTSTSAEPEERFRGQRRAHRQK